MDELLIALGLLIGAIGFAIMIHYLFILERGD